MDDKQRAIEMLATELERIGGWVADGTDEIRRGVLTPFDRAAVRVITAALRAAPEAVALRTAMTTLEQIASAPDDQGAKFNAMGALRFLQTQPVELRAEPEGFVLVPVEPCEDVLMFMGGHDDAARRRAYALMLAARPQGVM